MSEISIYPNPAFDESTIHFGKIGGEKRVSIFSISGVLVDQLTTQRDNYRLDLNNYESGDYLVNIRTDSGSENKSLVVS